MSKVLQERGFGSLPGSTKINLRDHVKSISTTVDADLNPIRRIRLRQYVVSDLQDKKGLGGLKDLEAYSIGTTLRNDTLPQKEKDPGSFTLRCYINNVCFEKDLADLGASICVMPFSTYTNLRLGELAHTNLRERMELDLEARLMGETLILIRSFDPLYGDYIKLNYLNVPLELRRNHVDDLEPTIEECEVVDKPMIDLVKTKNDNNMVNGINRYPSYCDFDRKIHIDYAYNLQFSCMIGFEHVNDNFFLILSINVMSKKFYNSIMKDKVKYNGRNVLGTFVNAPIFVGNFSVVTDFTVVENMDAYRDEGMGEVIVGESFCKASYVEARRFDGMITIFIGKNSVTYQMM
ncbi:hypothetical protein Tco_0272448 [Tanacetum coccineum]